MNKGYVQVYTGNGKGKTTAALGLILRALGAQKKVLLVQFMKAVDYSENNILSHLSTNLVWRRVGEPVFLAKDEEIPESYAAMVREAFEDIKADVIAGIYDMVVLDEINCALYFNLLETNDVIGLIRRKHIKTELVLTGRSVPLEIVGMADLVTEMKEVRHYYQTGVLARKGIEN